MAETTGIAWTRSTFNPWIGCTEVSTEKSGGGGCDGCYARALDARHKWGGAAHWGSGVPRYRTKEANWAKPLKWDKFAADEKWRAEHREIVTPFVSGRPGFWPVFCASLGDVFDNEVPDQWRMDLFSLIADTPNLSWLLVTKRIGNVLPMCRRDGLMFDMLPHIRILITVVNQEEADRDIPKLLALPCKNGISYEPALGAVDWSPWLPKRLGEFVKTPQNEGDLHAYPEMVSARTAGIDWLIIGGESSQPGHPARPFNLEWARSTIEQCKAAEVPVFVKQLGSFAYGDANDLRNPGLDGDTPLIGDGRGGVLAHWKLKDRAGTDPAEWPSDLRVMEFPA